MADYKIVKVSQQPPREWYNETYKSTTYYIKVQLEGHNKPVEIGKKKPDALKAGDVVSGKIIPKDGYPNDNFKPDPVSFGGGNRKEDPAKQDSIMRMNALTNAVSLHQGGKVKEVTETADQLYAWLRNEKIAETGGEVQAEVKTMLDDAVEVPDDIDVDTLEF